MLVISRSDILYLKTYFMDEYDDNCVFNHLFSILSHGGFHYWELLRGLYTRLNPAVIISLVHPECGFSSSATLLQLYIPDSYEPSLLINKPKKLSDESPRSVRPILQLTNLSPVSALLKRRLQLRLDRNSTALRPFDNLRFDRRPNQPCQRSLSHSWPPERRWDQKN